MDEPRSATSTNSARITRGSHHIFAHPALPEMVNLQDVGGEAKPYQIRQFLRLIEKYNITLEDAE